MNARVLSSLAFALVMTLSGCLSSSSRRVAPDAAIDLWVDDRADPARPEAPVLVVPGAAWLDRDLEPLSAYGRVVYYDLRGRGHSPPVQRNAGMRIEHDVADLERVRLQLGVERISVLGWDYRGGVAVRYAIAHPEHVERLVLVAPLPTRRDPYWKTYRRRILARSDSSELDRINEIRTSGLKRRNPELYARRVVNASLQLFVADAADLGAMASDPCVLPNLDPDVTARLGGEILDALGAWDWRIELAQLTTPVLVVHGSSDLLPIESSREFVASLPNARLLELDDVAHMPWLEQPETFFPAVLSFLTEADGTRP